MKYYIISGERSGDLHGGNLIKELKNLDKNATFRGFGGEYMEAAGAEITVRYSELAVMGFVEVVFNLNKISNYIRFCKNDILTESPDVVILVDYGGFNLRIAKFCKANGIRVFYYIPPKVWAWYEKRAVALKENTDSIFVILPFEKTFFEKFDCKVEYVGNPVLDAVKAHNPDKNFIDKYHLSKDKSLIALLPGSRKQELQRIVPLFVEVAMSMPDHQFAVAAVNNLDHSLYTTLIKQPNVKLIYEDSYNLLLHSSAAVVTSGTATLETALFKVPQIVVYKTNWFSYWLAKRVIRVPFISLVNLIAGKEIIREMIQSQANVGNIVEELKLLLTDKYYRGEILKEYEDIVLILDVGSASQNAATLMYQSLLKN